MLRRWTTDVGGYGCNVAPPTSGAYMRELIVRWYQFGLFCPVFRTHGCRNGPSEPDVAPCKPAQGSCGFNEVCAEPRGAARSREQKRLLPPLPVIARLSPLARAHPNHLPPLMLTVRVASSRRIVPAQVWSYGDAVQPLLERYVRLRATKLLPYIRELATNVSAHGVATMRPLAYEFPADAGATMINDQYMLGPALLVAPVVEQNATSRQVYFPCESGLGSTRWVSFWDAATIVPCGVSAVQVDAPLDVIPVYQRRSSG